MTKATYVEKLKDPRWQEKRLRIFDRDKWTCFECHDKTLTKHVHHKRYFPGKDPWDIDDKYLCTLCEQCHELEEQLKANNCELKHYAAAGNTTCLRMWRWIKAVSFLSSCHPDEYKKLAEYGNANIVDKYGDEFWEHGSIKK